MKRTALFAGLLSGLLFGMATPLSKTLLTGLNAFQLAGLLYLGAAVAMLPHLFRKGNHFRKMFIRENRLKTFGIVFFGGFAGPLLLLLGLKSAHAASVAIWLNMELVATALLGVLFFRDSLDRFAWTGVLLTLAAGILTSLGEGTGSLLSGLLVTAACLSWAIDNHLTALTDGSSPQSVTFVKGLMAGSANLLLGCMISGEAPPTGSLLPALGVGVLSYGASIVLYVMTAQQLGATRGQVLFSTAPLWGVLLSYFFLGEPFQWTQGASVILLAAAVVASNLLRHTHEHRHEAVTHLHFHRHDDEHHDHDHPEGVPPEKGHTHLHTHQAVLHGHPHHPDLHHRHRH